MKDSTSSWNGKERRRRYEGFCSNDSRSFSHRHVSGSVRDDAEGGIAVLTDGSGKIDHHAIDLSRQSVEVLFVNLGGLAVLGVLIMT